MATWQGMIHIHRVCNSFWTPCQTRTLSQVEFFPEDSATSNSDTADHLMLPVPETEESEGPVLKMHTFNHILQHEVFLNYHVFCRLKIPLR